MIKSTIRIAIRILVPILAITLGGCGGGNQRSGLPQRPPVATYTVLGVAAQPVPIPGAPALKPPPAGPFDTNEYRALGSLDRINALPAYEAGLSGNDIGIAALQPIGPTTITASNGNLAPAFGDTYLGLGIDRGSVGFAYALSNRTSISFASTIARFERNQHFLGGPKIAAEAVLRNARFSYDNKTLSLRVTAGALNEQNAVLGSQYSGGLRLGDGASTFYGRLDLSYDLGSNSQLFAFGTFGFSQISGSGGALLTNLSDFTTTSFAVGYVGHNTILENDRLGIALSQPLRVESGHYAITLPKSGSYYSGNLGYDTAMVSLSPSGREIDLELSYRWQANEQHLHLGASILLMRQAGHTKRHVVGAVLLLNGSLSF